MKTHTEITLTAYDPTWIADYETEIRLIQRQVSDERIRLDHIGSTAVPGLIAKPIIDVQMQVESLEPVETYAGVFGAIGFRIIDSGEEDLRIALRKRTDSNANLHIVKSGSWAGQRTILFRDALREDPRLVEEYTRLKLDLARNSQTLLVYTLAKTEFIEDTLRRRCARLDIPYSPGNRQ